MRRFVSLFLGLASSLACGDAAGPSLHGPPFLKVGVDGHPVPGVIAYAGCGNFGLILYTAPLTPAIPYADVLEIYLADLHRTGTFHLADTASGSFARTFSNQPVGLAYKTDSLAPGQLTISALSFRDSVVAGSFAFRLFDYQSSSNSYYVDGSFRVHLDPIAGPDNPQVTTCQAATP